MNSKNKVSDILSLIVWVPVVFFSVLLTHNAMLYFTHGGDYGILPEKVLARKDFWWNVSFYIHLPAGTICLLTPLILFIGRIFKLPRKFHKVFGSWYVWITLLLVCPTGMYLTLYAKGGFITQAGFMVQAIALGYYTYRGYKAIKEGNRSEHVDSMIRSYAFASVVLTFRILHILFMIWKVPYQDNYAMSQWLGIACNGLLAEILIYIKTIKLKNRKLKPVQL